jgi:NADH-ubiquinone oxidoreductase chain 5
MAAPTPVSSLVHSSTLVTAGVYLLIRINFILTRWINLRFLLVLGSLTILIAGISAMGEVDIKKIIALSTLRQLGLIFFVLGIGLPILSFFHLIIHAYFKAMLFICAGGVIHRIKEFQDLRAMGRGLKQIPISASIFLIANLSLCGVPFIRGFFSKDLILELMIISGSRITTLILAILATGITVAYSCRIIKLVFFHTPL